MDDFAYRWDEEGFYAGDTLIQKDAVDVFLPNNCTETKPDASIDRSENFLKWNGEAWIAVPKPKTAADLVGVVVSHKTKTLHDIEMRHLINTLTFGSTEYRIVRGEDLSWSVEKIPDPTIEEQRAAKKAELESAFLRWYETDAVVTSSLGFVADSDERAVTDVIGLIAVCEAQPEEARETVAFMDHDNAPHLLDLAQLKTLQLEILQNGQAAYQQKWTMRTKIEAAESKESLAAVEIKFTGLDFSATTEEGGEA